MQRLLLALLPYAIACSVAAQSSSDAGLNPKFRKQPISQTGCYAYLPEGFVWEESTKSEDGSRMYQGSKLFDGGYEFGFIMVQFLDPFTNSSKEDLENLLISYADYLKQTFKIASSVGYGRGATLASDNSVSGIIDYWEGDDKAQWSVKGWINKNYLAFYYILGPDDKADKFREIYFNGIRFAANSNSVQVRDTTGAH